MEELKYWGFGIKLGKVLRRRMRGHQPAAIKEAKRFANVHNTDVIYWDEATPSVMVVVEPNPLIARQLGT